MSTNLTEQEFAKHLGTSFQLVLDGQMNPLKLTEVKGYLPKGNEHGGMERFSILFEGPGSLRLPQSIYRLQHDSMGEFEIFLVPISGDDKGFRYEAVFNYFKK